MSRPRQRLLGAADRVRARTLLLVLVVIGMCLTWALSIARYGGPDETGHVLRAADVAQGRLLGDTIPGLVSGFRAVTVPAPLASGDPMCFRHDKRVPATCGDSVDELSGERTVGSSAGTNPPWYYAMVGAPARLLGDPADVLSYRIVAALFCGLVLALAAARANGRGVLVLLVALSPATWFLTGVVNPSSLEIALFLLAWIGVERLRIDPRVRDTAGVWWVGLPLGTAILIRPIALIGAVVVLAVLYLLRRGAGSLSRRDGVLLLVAPAAACVASLVWSVWSSVAVSDDRAATDLSLVRVLRESLAGTADTVHEIGGQLGWLEFSAPSPAQWLWWAGVVACGIVAISSRVDRRLRTSWSAVAAASITIPVVFETVLANRLGFIWQGRYTIPTALGLVVLGSSRWSRSSTNPGRNDSRERSVLVSVLVLAAVAEVATLWTALRRYSVGIDGSWSFTGAIWRPPVSPWALLAANAALMLTLCAMAALPVISVTPLPPCDERR